MEIITGTIDGFTRKYPLSKLGKREEILALDIETTGFSPEHAHIYLIGCAYWDGSAWKTIQWFDDDGNGESDILTSFILFAKRFSVLLHYNGDRFDLPFLTRRIVWNGLQGIPGAEDFPKEMKSADLYRYVKSYQRILSLPDLKLKTVERYFETGRMEEESGGDLIKAYQEYLKVKKNRVNPNGPKDSKAIDADLNAADILKNQDDTDRQKDRDIVREVPTGTPEDLRKRLLEHNEADLAGLIGISDVIAFSDLFSAKLNVYKAQANTYRDAEGNPVQELWLYARTEGIPEDMEKILRKPITTNRDGCYLSINGNKVTIKAPVFHGKAYYFYANYKDYYYLPELDQAIHKSISTFVDSRRREQATARNCYTAKAGVFLPEWFETKKAAPVSSDAEREEAALSNGIPYEPFFKRSYEDQTAWFVFSDEKKKDRQFFSDYAAYLYHHIVFG